jgi:hypothetical protein
MTLQHFDSVIAFLAVMLAASLVVTAGTQLVIALLGLRGANLHRSLADLFEGASDDRDARRYSKVIARRVLRQPLVSDSLFSRFGIRLDALPYMPADAAGKLRWAGSGIPLQPWLLGAACGFFLWPATLFAIRTLFAFDFCAYSEILTNHISILDLCGHPWRTGAILGAVFGGLLGRWRLATSIRIDELTALLDKLSAPAGGTLPDPAQRAMLVLAGEARNGPRPKSNPVSAQIDRMLRETTEEGEGGVAVAVEKAVAQVPAQVESPRLAGLNLWFDHAMERASQRFTLQARLITVALSAFLVFAAHLDAIRLFRSLSSDAQIRAQMAGSAEALIKQAEQLPRAKEAGRTVVPDVYRTAMVAMLETTPVTAEEPKSKLRRSSHTTTAAPADGAPAPSGGAAPGEVQISASAAQSSEESLQATPAVAQTSSEPAAKPHDGKASRQAKAKSSAKAREETAAAPAPREDRALIEAKSKALKALEVRPGFASREDAALWLEETLKGDPALENLSAAYQQEVNAELPGDADRLIDHSASITRALARSELQPISVNVAGSKPREDELPGMLVTVVLLSLGAPLCYNLLKALASLRPLPTVK